MNATNGSYFLNQPSGPHLLNSYGRNSICFLLRNSSASEFFMPTFQNTLSVPSSQAGRYDYPPMKMEQSVPKRWRIKFRSRGITQKKVYDIQNTAKV